MGISMYDKLLELPLFQGLRKEDFTCIIEKVKFHFHKYVQGETIAQQGEICSKLMFLLDGMLVVQTVDEEHCFRFSEIWTSPCIIEPYSLFGMHPFYNATYSTQGETKILTIDKSYIMEELHQYDIFRLNYLNLLSNWGQANHRKLWNNHIGTLKEKLANFILLRCTKPEGEKTLYIGMEELATLIKETRINVSKLLNELHDKGIIELKRREIHIPEFKTLLEELQQ